MTLATELQTVVGPELFMDFNQFKQQLDSALKASKHKLAAGLKNQLINAVSWRDENAEKVIKKVYKLKGDKVTEKLDVLSYSSFKCQPAMLGDFGLWPSESAGEYIEYESDSELRDTESVPLKESIHDYFQREVRPHVSEAWINLGQTKIGYEISFNKYFYQHKPLRSLADVTKDILDLEAETEGLLKQLVTFGETH
jgi:type I restriction enzyme M protein